jgi:N-acetylglucosaminyldiphosphoundecaprenol N-acetyl-beta-D-mannosaminyltransferase
VTPKEKDSLVDRRSLPQRTQDDRVNVLGLGVTPLNLSLAVEVFAQWIARREKRYVCVAAVHTVMACRHDPALLRICNGSGMTTPDGMPLVWLSRRAGHRHVERVYGPDLMAAACADGLKPGYRHFFYGGEPGAAEALAMKLETRFPELQVAGTLSPPFGEMAEAEEAALNERINASKADIVWVGLGTGTQEHWMGRNRPRLDAPVLIGVGAAFDFLSGRKPQAPRWLQRRGMEWFFRLATEPRRLWPRYREYPVFLLLLAGQLAGLKEYPLSE